MTAPFSLPPLAPRLTGRRALAPCRAAQEILSRSSRHPEGPRLAVREGEIEVAGFRIACAELADGRSVLLESDVLAAIGRIRPYHHRDFGGKAGALKASPLLTAVNLSPFVPERTAALAEPIAYRRSEGTPDWRRNVFGVRPELIVPVCETYLRARDAGALRRRQEMAAKAAERIVAALEEKDLPARMAEAWRARPRT